MVTLQFFAWVDYALCDVVEDWVISTYSLILLRLRQTKPKMQISNDYLYCYSHVPFSPVSNQQHLF